MRRLAIKPRTVGAPTLKDVDVKQVVEILQTMKRDISGRRAHDLLALESLWFCAPVSSKERFVALSELSNTAYTMSGGKIAAVSQLTDSASLARCIEQTISYCETPVYA